MYLRILTELHGEMGARPPAGPPHRRSSGCPPKSDSSPPPTNMRCAAAHRHRAVLRSATTGQPTCMLAIRNSCQSPQAMSGAIARPNRNSRGSQRAQRACKERRATLMTPPCPEESVSGAAVQAGGEVYKVAGEEVGVRREPPDLMQHQRVGAPHRRLHMATFERPTCRACSGTSRVPNRCQKT